MSVSNTTLIKSVSATFALISKFNYIHKSISRIFITRKEIKQEKRKKTKSFPKNVLVEIPSDRVVFISRNIEHINDTNG